MNARPFSTPEDAEDFGPWFQMIRHQLTESEVNEMLLCALEADLTVHQWIERAIKTQWPQFMTHDR
jgi:hypothetical protein